ncbi:MAG: bifunctional pyr operon transcriptional regulator/uracil phosphoribosyltransferase PyrR [Gammaproteobacteria bacterium]|nr:MAG: bifunctional pyr operon transcriptional regulator/uracil phosphoribosyltransferase PyrR [Gammaproteobacteria bacterium]
MNDPLDASALLDQLTTGLTHWLTESHRPDPLMVGIHTGGAWVAEQLHTRLGFKEPLGRLDIAFYRDDFTRIGMHPLVRPSQLPFEIEGRHLVLVDDVLHTGRTIRAALNELFDYGRPASVALAVLIDRGGRELPIVADVIGTMLELPPEQHIKLSGPEPLALAYVKRGTGRENEH